jgi:hypothetical protein
MIKIEKEKQDCKEERKRRRKRIPTTTPDSKGNKLNTPLPLPGTSLIS